MVSEVYLLRILQVGVLLSFCMGAHAMCNVCSPLNSMACYSSTQMQACDVNSLPVGPAFSCPNGFVCTYGTAGVICEPSSTSASLAACQDCNKCDANNTFACTSTGTFALCLGTTAPQQVVGTCAPQYVCNINNPEICGQVTQGVMPTCSHADDKRPHPTWRPPPPSHPWTTTTTIAPSTTTTTTTTTTTVSPGTNPTAYCNVIRMPGNYPVGTNPTTTCKQYVKCWILNGSWYGQVYTCPGSTNFNIATRLCQSIPLPTQCSAAVVSLSLNGVELD